jgi:hypothetical protein
MGTIGSTMRSCRRRRLPRARLFGVAVMGVCFALAGCSTPASESSFTVFADPGKYLYYSCDQISAQMRYWTTREQELRMLMDKAEQGAGGAVVNLIAYKADYVAATEELQLLNRAARDKNCDTPSSWRSNNVIR